MSKKFPQDMTAAELRALAEEHRATMKKEWMIFLKTGITTIAAVVVLVAASIAWFANNREVSSNGMQTQVQVTSNLVISDNPETLKTLLNGESVADPFACSFDKAARMLIPASHSFTCPTDSAACAAGLYYSKNPKEISTANGLAIGGGAITFEAVPSGSPGNFYEDYEVYIAASGVAFEATSLTASMSITPAAGITLQDYMQAASIDFYLDSVSEGNYLGTLNVIGYDYAVNNHSTKRESLEFVGSVFDGMIPLNTSDSSIHIVMRCYFDGALLKEDTTTFVRSEGLSTGAFSLNVKFAAED